LHNLDAGSIPRKTYWTVSHDGIALRNPITGIVGCCARGARPRSGAAERTESESAITKDYYQ
jgi:hypothetical protein